MIKYIQLFLVLVFCLVPNLSFSYQMVYVTAFWQAESGGQFDCDGNRLCAGAAAVDFDDFPKGSTLVLGENVIVHAVDRGGCDVINRKAPHKKGLNVPVIDVYFRTKAEADRFPLNAQLVRVRQVEKEIFEFPSYESQKPQKILHRYKVIPATRRKYLYETR